MDVDMEDLNLKLIADSTVSNVQTYEAAIGYFINQLPENKRPKSGDIIDVSIWSKTKVKLKSN